MHLPTTGCSYSKQRNSPVRRRTKLTDMSWLRLSLFLAVLSLLAAPFAAGAAPVRTPHVEAELVAERTAVSPGEAVTLALRLKMIPHWHTYWRNPGDSGLPTSIDWKLPAGFSAGPIQWPYPQRLPIGPLMNFGYEGEVFLLSDLKVPKDVQGDSINIAARANWLVCNPETCIPERADLSLHLPVGGGGNSTHAGAIASTRAALPVAAGEFPGWNFAARRTPDRAAIDVLPPSGAALGTLTFFPYEEGRIENSAPQPFSGSAGVYRLTLKAVPQQTGEFGRAVGILVASDGFGGTSGPRAIEIDLPFGATAAPANASPKIDALTLGVALVFAFIGGLILNLMPCVLPVVSIKVLSFVEHGAKAVHGTRKHGLLFALGVVLSFWFLAGLLLALRSTGAELGWGFQLQSPAVVAVLAMFFFALGLNLSGVYEFGSLLPGGVAGWRARNPYVDSLFSGVLAVAVASPCTAPFMGAALGYAVGESGVSAFLVFTALGLGMALPYVLLAWFPRWLRHVPKPGAWMERLKQFLAFPIYGTVVWLVWVFGLQAGMNAVAMLLVALVLLGVAAWLLGMRFSRPVFASVAAAVLALVAIGIAMPRGVSALPAAVAKEASGWEEFSPERLSAYTDAGKPVFIDFTAAWCVTCQVNKQLVLQTADVQQAFKNKGVTLMVADWTREDEKITRALAAFGRNGVPLYVLYRPKQEPLVLPAILTTDLVLDALQQL